MLTRLTIALSEQERAALQAKSEKEMRGLRDEARFILRSTLERDGWLHADVNLAERPEVGHDDPH